MLKLIKNASKLLINNSNKLVNSQLGALLHTTNVLDKKFGKDNVQNSKWMQFNKIKFEPQKPDEEPRPAVS